MCAILAGVIAYAGVLKNIQWNKIQKGKQISKIINDLRVDSDVVILQLLIFDALLKKDLPEKAISFLQDMPLELGYKFYDDDSIEFLDSTDRLNVRGMASSLEKFNRFFKEQDFEKASEQFQFFLFSYEKVFGGYEAKKSLATKLSKTVKENSVVL